MAPATGSASSSPDDVIMASSASTSGQSTSSGELNKSYSPMPETGSSTPPALPPRPPNLPLPRERNTPTQRHIANSYSREAQLSQQSTSSLSSLPRPPSSSPNTQTHSNHQPPAPLELVPNQGRRREGGGAGGQSRSLCGSLGKKYVLMCWLCGGLCLALGIMYIVIFFLLDRYTTSLHYFQTLPTWVPSIPLIITASLIFSFARRGNRNNCLVKICGFLCLVCAILCVVVTITTTVIHMNRLQTLRECVYQAVPKTCTCFAGILDPHSREPGMHYVFGGTENCDVIHGILYSCLRALFGISVVGILVCIFSCMLVYQISSHEKKKEYWAQLEHRCRYLHSQGHHPHIRGGSRFPPHSTIVPNSISGNMIHGSNSMCDCCSPHEDDLWTTQASGLSRGANLYSPNPVLASAHHNPLQTNCSQPPERIASNLGPPSAANVGQSQSFSSLRSFRNWLPSLGRVANLTSSVRARPSHNGGGVQGTRGEASGDGRNAGQNGSNHPWRRSVQLPAEATYGFHQRVYPASCHYLSSLLNPVPPHGLTLPQYVWDPPPPYSNGNLQEDQSQSSAANGPSGSTANSTHLDLRSSNGSHNANPGGSNGQCSSHHGGPSSLAQELQQIVQSSAMVTTLTSTSTSSSPSSSTPRTTKSGLLPSFPAPPEAKDVITEDLTIHSGMHLYEKAGNGTYSLPSRRIKKKKPTTANDLTKSVTDLVAQANLNEEEVLMQEVRQKLNALLLYKYQHSKTSKDLAEVRQALQSLQTGAHRNIYGKMAPFSEARKHSFPNLGMSSLSRNKGGNAGGTHTTGGNGRNRNSTSSGTSSVENKYETIEKSLSPYKISNNAVNNNNSHHNLNTPPISSSSPPQATPYQPNVNISIRKQMQLNHGGAGSHHAPAESPSKLTLQKLLQLAAVSPSASSGSPLPRDALGYPRDGELPLGGRFSALSSPASSSSHYAQISPLRGIGMPRMTPTYFQELHKQDAMSHSSPLASKAANTHMVTASSESRLASSEAASSPSGPTLLKQVSQSAIQLNNQNLLKLQEIKWCFQPQNRYDLNDNNISKSDPKLAQKVDLRQGGGTALKKSQYHQPGFRAVRSVPSSATQTPLKHVMPDCVYLRPEQNIPEIFASTNFKPIGGQSSMDSKKHVQSTRISRDDIVVTMRSAQV